MRKTLASILVGGLLALAAPVIAASPAAAVSSQCGHGTRPWKYAPPKWCRYASTPQVVTYSPTVDGPDGLWKLPAVPSQATGCYSLAGYKVPSGQPVPPNWFKCSTGTHTFAFAVNYSGYQVPVHWYGGVRGGKISYSANPYATVTLP